MCRKKLELNKLHDFDKKKISSGERFALIDKITNCIESFSAKFKALKDVTNRKLQPIETFSIVRKQSKWERNIAMETTLFIQMKDLESDVLMFLILIFFPSCHGNCLRNLCIKGMYDMVNTTFTI